MKRFGEAGLLALFWMMICIETTGADSAEAENQKVLMDFTADFQRSSDITPITCSNAFEGTPKKGYESLSFTIHEKRSFAKTARRERCRSEDKLIQENDNEEREVYAKINRDEDGNVNLTVKNSNGCTICVSLYDKNDVLLFEELLIQEKSFSKLYVLSKLRDQQLKMEVRASGTILINQNI
jgi:hypothetical protein